MAGDSSFQELDLRPEVLVLNETGREKEWIASIESAIGSSYVQVRLLRQISFDLFLFFFGSQLSYVFPL